MLATAIHITSHRRLHICSRLIRFLHVLSRLYRQSSGTSVPGPDSILSVSSSLLYFVCQHYIFSCSASPALPVFYDIVYLVHRELGLLVSFHLSHLSLSLVPRHTPLARCCYKRSDSMTWRGWLDPIYRSIIIRSALFKDSLLYRVAHTECPRISMALRCTCFRFSSLFLFTPVSFRVSFRTYVRIGSRCSLPFRLRCPTLFIGVYFICLTYAVVGRVASALSGADGGHLSCWLLIPLH